MKKMTVKKMQLDRETLRALDDHQLLLLVGGRMSAQTCGASCGGCTSF